MFRDSKISQEYNSGRTKTTYVVTDGIDPVFHNEIVRKLNNTVFSLLIDESNKQYGKKYLHMLVQYYDTTLRKVEVDFLGACVVNQANANNLVEAIVQQMKEDDLPWTNVIPV